MREIEKLRKKIEDLVLIAEKETKTVPNHCVERKVELTTRIDIANQILDSLDHITKERIIKELEAFITTESIYNPYPSEITKRLLIDYKDASITDLISNYKEIRRNLSCFIADMDAILGIE